MPLVLNPTEVEYDDAAHRYRCRADGSTLDSVTGVLKYWGYIDNTFGSEYALTVGKYTHLGIELYRKNDLDWDSLDGATIRPRVQAMQKFEQETGYRSLYSEIVVWNQMFRYAGTIDELGILKNEYAIIDYKTGLVKPWTGLQLGGYEKCKLPPQFMGKPIKRYGLELRLNGTYRLEPFTDANHGALFCGLAANMHWRRNNGFKGDYAQWMINTQ